MVTEWLQSVSRAVTGRLRNDYGVVTVLLQGGNGGFEGPKS